MANRKEELSEKYSQLTMRQELIFDFICKYLEQHPYPPTVREIQNSLKIKSTSTVQYALNALEEHGFIIRSDGKMRSIEIPQLNHNITDHNIVMTPVVGSVAAGEPIFADENITDYYPLPSGTYTASNKHFILEVRGNSMIDAGILNGDFVIIEQCNIANDGEIVAALIDDSATIKRFFKEKDHVRLQPENKEMEPIIVEGELMILGKVVGLYRTSII